MSCSKALSPNPKRVAAGKLNRLKHPAVARNAGAVTASGTNHEAVATIDRSPDAGGQSPIRSKRPEGTERRTLSPAATLRRGPCPTTHRTNGSFAGNGAIIDCADE